MNKKIKVIIVGSIMTIFGFATIYASSNQNPGSVQDPLVTKSYVDSKILEIANLGSNRTSGGSSLNVDELIEQIELVVDFKLKEKGITSGGVTQKDSDESIDGFVFKPIGPIKSGSILIGEQGTEMILRSGSAVVIAEGINGLQDITDGVDLPANAIVPNNHLLIVPRTDGRGIFIERDETYVMLRGNYEIQEN